MVQYGEGNCLKWYKTGQSGIVNQDKIENGPKNVQTEPNGLWNGERNKILEWNE